MSWGERSCSKLGICNYNPTFGTCNVDCEGYISNGKKPDSISMKEIKVEKISTLSRRERRMLERKKK
jgi:hypothetical protein